ncbi:unnamed protein product [Ambrosiozyma monospora]|uniref:Unnamed protein product n=1 Tax=Ambrosiozyma monospora TaxID=43982 RepID=A0A9W6Z7R2_AMBMO|nr:unnamed protein product [Ambrosiozyma monospora]
MLKNAFNLLILDPRIKQYQTTIPTDPIPDELSQKITNITKDIPTSLLLENFDQKPVLSCIVLEIRLKNDKNIHINDPTYASLFDLLTASLSLPQHDFVWNEGENQDIFQQQIRVKSYYISRLIDEVLDHFDGISSNSIQKMTLLDKLSVFYKSDGVPWSNSSISRVCNSCLKKLKPTEKEILQLLLSMKDTLKELNEINRQNSKITKRGYRRHLAHADLFRGISPLLGSSFSSILNQSDAFNKAHIGKVQSLRYMLDKLSLSDIEGYWNMILPLLLHFLDDTNLMIKAVACKNLITILEKIENKTSNIITKTDIGKVLFDSVIPCLLALPSLTPVSESMKILPSAYRSIFLLIDVGFSKRKDVYYTKLDSVLNDFVLSSLGKVGDYPELVIFLIDVILVDIIPRLKAYYIVVSKAICYAGLNILSNPYSVYSPEMLSKCIELIEVVLDKTQNPEKFKYDIFSCLMLVMKRIDKYQSTNEKALAVRETASTIITNRLDLAKEMVKIRAFIRNGYTNVN